MKEQMIVTFSAVIVMAARKQKEKKRIEEVTRARYTPPNTVQRTFFHEVDPRPTFHHFLVMPS